MIKKFCVGDDIVEATHLWRTHPYARGAARFGWVFRMCKLVSDNGDTAVVQFTGLKSKPKKTIPKLELIDLADVNSKDYFILT